jgi:predicted RNA binding protein YcfA (HicA-like mRNA interferase family)
MEDHPNSVRFADLEAVLRRAGFEGRQQGTSHIVFRHAGLRISIVRPHGDENFVKPAYVREALDVLKILEEDSANR